MDLDEQIALLKKGPITITIPMDLNFDKVVFTHQTYDRTVEITKKGVERMFREQK